MQLLDLQLDKVVYAKRFHCKKWIFFSEIRVFAVVIHQYVKRAVASLSFGSPHLGAFASVESAKTFAVKIAFYLLNFYLFKNILNLIGDLKTNKVLKTN